MASGSHGQAAALAIIATSLAAAPSWSQTYTVASVSNVQIGTVAAATTGVTVFIGDGRSVTDSGAGAYISGTRSNSIVGITCVDGSGAANSCANNAAHIVITRPGVNTGRAQGITLIETSICCYTGTTVAYGSGNLDFTWNPWSAAGTLQFAVSARLAVLGDDASLATTASSQFGVAVAKNPAVPTQFTYAAATATVQRSLQIKKVSDLNFGTWVRGTGSNTASMHIFGYRTVDGSGTSTGCCANAGSAASLNVSGEPGTSYTLSYPSTFAMTGPGSITVTVVGGNQTGTQTIPNSGTMNLLFGGSWPISSTTPTGYYTGSFPITVVYN